MKEPGEAPPFYGEPRLCILKRPCFCPSVRVSLWCARHPRVLGEAGVPRVEWIRTRLGMFSRGVIQRASISFGSAVTAVTAAKP